MSAVTFTTDQVIKGISNCSNTKAFGPDKLWLSPTLFSFYIADMSRPTAPVKRICYADDITVWASGVEITELEHKVNTYLTEMSKAVPTGKLAFDISTKVISDLVYARPGAGQYPSEDQDC